MCFLVIRPYIRFHGYLSFFFFGGSFFFLPGGRVGFPSPRGQETKNQVGMALIKRSKGSCTPKEPDICFMCSMQRVSTVDTMGTN